MAPASIDGSWTGWLASRLAGRCLCAARVRLQGHGTIRSRMTPAVSHGQVPEALLAPTPEKLTTAPATASRRKTCGRAGGKRDETRRGADHWAGLTSVGWARSFQPKTTGRVPNQMAHMGRPLHGKRPRKGSRAARAESDSPAFSEGRKRSDRARLLSHSHGGGGGSSGSRLQRWPAREAAWCATWRRWTACAPSC